MKSSRVLFLLGFVLGGLSVLAAFSLLPQSKSGASGGATADGGALSSLRERIQSLVDKDLADYERLKSLEEKYQKADEILGKVMTILLVDLGIRVSPQLRAHLQREITKEADRLESMPKTAVAEKKALVSETPTLRAVVTEPALEASGGILAEIKAKTKFENRIEELRSDDDIQGFLTNTRISAPRAFLNQANEFSNQNHLLTVLNGTFSGRASVTVENRARIWDVEVYLNARPDGPEQNITGSMRTRMAENGHTFSQGSDEGGVPSLREFSEGTRAMVINASPTVFFQVYYVPQLNSLIGNVYQRTSRSSEYSWIGTLQLKKI